MEKNLYIIQKHIMAESVEDALIKEKKFKVSEVFINGDWMKEKIAKIIDKKIYKQ